MPQCAPMLLEALPPGPHRAAADTGHALEPELAIVRRLAGADVQPILEVRQQLVAAAHVASSALTDADRVVGGWLEAKLGVKGRHAVNLVCRDPGCRGELAHGFLRQIAVTLLDFLQHRDQ